MKRDFNNKDALPNPWPNLELKAECVTHGEMQIAKKIIIIIIQFLPCIFPINTILFCFSSRNDQL